MSVKPAASQNVSRFVRLRHAEPQLPASLLSKLPHYFPRPAEPLALSREYEPEVEPHDDDKEKAFRNLQRFRDAGLVEPIGVEHMYHAAMESKACGLTTLGKYYWRLANENKI